MNFFRISIFSSFFFVCFSTDIQAIQLEKTITQTWLNQQCEYIRQCMLSCTAQSCQTTVAMMQIIALQISEVEKKYPQDELTVNSNNQEMAIKLYQELAQRKRIRPSKENIDCYFAEIFSTDQMTELFRKSTDAPAELNPLFPIIESLSNGGTLFVTLPSGPGIYDFTHLLLGTHELQLNEPSLANQASLKLFNNAETFLRCLYLFAQAYKAKTGKSLNCEVRPIQTKIRLRDFCTHYFKQFPQLADLLPAEQEKFVRLLSVFMIGDDIVELYYSFAISITTDTTKERSFKPVGLQFGYARTISNELSEGQQDLSKQIQNLNGSDQSMIYIKDADGAAQLRACQSLLGRTRLEMLDVGGGRGETNALFQALKEAGSTLKILNVEPHRPFAQQYIDACVNVGVPDVQVVDQTAQDFKPSPSNKFDLILASHSFYFLLADLHKATLEYTFKPTKPLSEHPLYKFFNTLTTRGVMVVTMQTGAGARLMRNALMGNHGLNSTTGTDEIISLLASFGNIATFLRHFDFFALRYEIETSKKIEVKAHYCVASVPLGDFYVTKDTSTEGYILRNPAGGENETTWISPTMLDFYGNWKELQTLATLSDEALAHLTSEQLQTMGLTRENVNAKRADAILKQKIFLLLLPLFTNKSHFMLHPNITLEVKVHDTDI